VRPALLVVNVLVPEGLHPPFIAATLTEYPGEIEEPE
jgi:hypothetical protein